MVRKLSKKARIENRGLPDDYDPRYFYEYRIMKRSKEATGIEGLLYTLMPWSLIKSFAFAIDPLSNFKTAPGKIASVNRTRTRTVRSVLDVRTYRFDRVTRTIRAETNYLGIPGKYGPKKPDPPVFDNGLVTLASQDPLPDTSKDTTYRTRPFGYTMGEFDKVKHKLYVPSRSRYVYDNGIQLFSTAAGDDYPNYHGSFRNDALVLSSVARFREFEYTPFVNGERDLLLQKMQKEALSMYKGINPLHRNYSLFRNVVELRDLPRSIATLRDTMRNLVDFERLLKPDILRTLRLYANNPSRLKAVLKNLPSEYLSYSFGWRQLYNDVSDLLIKPKRISDQIDFLIRRAGKPTTYRSKREYVSGSSGVSGFSTDIFFLQGENQLSQESSVARKITLQMVINTTFSFPGINTPTFRQDLFSQKIGAYPSFTDLYNLTPWTWLVDWFTGLGNYVEIIDEMSRDRSLINWGFITGHSSVDLTTTQVTELDSRQRVSVDGVPGELAVVKNRQSVSSVLHLDLQLRRNVAGIFDVKTASDPSSLTNYQRSILGALLLQRTRFSR